VIKRRQLLQQATTRLAGLPVLVSSPALYVARARASDPEVGSSASGDEKLSQIERNKRLVREQYEKAQGKVIPSTLPSATDSPVAAPPLEKPSTVISAQDPPGGVDDFKAVLAAIGGWHAQSTAPAIHSFGPMIAEGDAVVEEWETFFHGLDGTMYSNHYCWIKQINDGQIAQVREYVDSHHAFIVLGLHAPWKVLEPPRAPRRRWRPGQSTLNAAPLTEIETAFPIRQEFELNPALLRDVTPTANQPNHFPDTVEGNKALIRAMHDAQAQGDAAATNSYYGKGFRHFIAGEGPLGWEHIPIQDLYAPLVKHLASPIKIRLGDMVSEGGRVFEEMDVLARLDDGSVYNNWHGLIHEIRDGQIVQTREYLDTHHLWVVLGRWADWGKTPVPPLRQARRSNMPYVTATYQARNPFLKLERWEPLPPAKS
jgi:ketosteroid isomerase-like protein